MEKVDVYTCSRCSEMFVVSEDKRAAFCPLCASVHFEWSHETLLLSLEEKEAHNG